MRSSLEVLQVPLAMSEYAGCQVNYAKASELCADSSSHAPMHRALLQQQSWQKGGADGPISKRGRAHILHNPTALNLRKNLYGPKQVSVPQRVGTDSGLFGFESHTLLELLR